MNTLLIIDVQNDFLPGGALPVPEGDRVIPVIRRLIPAFGLVVASLDWHPRGHGSFASQHVGKGPGEVIDLHGLPQVLWPDHCVQGTTGAALGPGLGRASIHHFVRKGEDPRVDSYSAFFDNGRRRATGLDAWLREHEVTSLCMAGLATDYCVLFTVLDALRLGYEVRVVAEGVRGVDLRPGDSSRALEQMRAAGASIVMEAEVLQAMKAQAA